MEKKSEARERILSTALGLFYDRGIKATGVDTIIAQSGVAKMTFYKHFPSKQLLVVEALKRAETLWFMQFEKAVAAKDDPREKLLSIFDFLAGWIQEPGFRGCAFINTAAETKSRETEECLFSSGHKRKVAERIEKIARDGGLKRPRELSEQWLLLMDGAIVRALMEGSPAPARMAKAMARGLL